MKHWLWVLVTLIGLLTFTPGCTSGPSLDGTWTATSARPQTLVADAAITITFANGQVSGNAGCNHFGGAYSVSGGILKAPQLGTTLMFCGGPRGEQEVWFLAVLSSSPTVSVEGDTLILTGTASTVTFRRG